MWVYVAVEIASHTGINEKTVSLKLVLTTQEKRPSSEVKCNYASMGGLLPNVRTHAGPFSCTFLRFRLVDQHAHTGRGGVSNVAVGERQEARSWSRAIIPKRTRTAASCIFFEEAHHTRLEKLEAGVEQSAC